MLSCLVFPLMFESWIEEEDEAEESDDEESLNPSSSSKV